MLFSELRFFLFFAVVFAGAWLLTHRGRKIWLLVASYVFYGAWDWRFLSLILISTGVDFLVARRMETQTDAGRRRGLYLSLAVNLGLLATFKYFGFFVDSAVDLLEWAGVAGHRPSLAIVLPVGISFYTFQTLSYTIDVYRRRMPSTKSLLDFSLFVAFFPQLVAGPIVRAADFLPQLKERPSLASVQIRMACGLFLVGFFKKCCVSDNVAPFVDQLFADPAAYSGVSSILGTVLYGVQIYCDFSGYSDMAVATAALLGYRLCRNFDHPYFAVSISDFWRRWHISLSSWLRDYLYIPLGGSRCSPFRNGTNLMATMILGGLWHGAAWTFVAWGTMHGSALVVQRLLRRVLPSSLPRWPILAIGALVTYGWVHATWIFFRAESFGDAWTILGGITLLRPGDESLPSFLWAWVAVLGTVHYVFMRYRPVEALRSLPPLRFALAYGAAWAVCLALVPSGYRPFIYFQF